MPNALVGGINWRATVRRSYQDINNFVPHCLRSTERASSCACMGQKLLIKPDWIQNCMHFAKRHYNTRSIKSINSDLRAAIHIKYGSTGQIKITYSIWQGVRYMAIHTLLMYGINKVWSKTDLELWFIAQDTGGCHVPTYIYPNLIFLCGKLRSGWQSHCTHNQCTVRLNIALILHIRVSHPCVSSWS